MTVSPMEATGTSHEGHLFRISPAVSADCSFILIGMEFKRSHPGGVIVNYALGFTPSRRRFFSSFVTEVLERGTDCKQRSMFCWWRDEKAESKKAKINCCLKSPAQHT